jgi:ribonuclease P protein component
MTELGAKFGPSARLTDSAEFGYALKTKPIARGQHIFVHFSPNPALTARLGVIVPKRLLRLATARNAVKRVFREAFRQQRYRLRTGHFVIRLLRSPKYESLKELKAQLRGELDQLIFLLDRRYRHKQP